MDNTEIRALHYIEPGKIEVQKTPCPQPAVGEVLLKVTACGICGSDIHGYLGLTGRRSPLVVLGHEFCGEIVENEVKGSRFKIGDHVIVQPINFCGTCSSCRQGLTNMCLNKRFYGVLSENGAMAEYIAVAEKLLCPMPTSFPYYLGALTEPYAVAYGAIKKVDSFWDKRVLILGAGTIGLCLLQLVCLQQPKQIIVSDLSDARLETARALGADACINPEGKDFLQEIESLTHGAMIDYSIEAVGVQSTANQSIQSLKPGGTALWVGMSQKEMTINMQDVVCSARAVLGSFNYTQSEFEEVARLITSNKLDAARLVTEIISLEDCPDYFARIHSNPDDYIKVLVDPWKSRER